MNSKLVYLFDGTGGFTGCDLGQALRSSTGQSNRIYGSDSKIFKIPSDLSSWHTQNLLGVIGSVLVSVTRSRLLTRLCSCAHVELIWRSAFYFIFAFFSTTIFKRVLMDVFDPHEIKFDSLNRISYEMLECILFYSASGHGSLRRERYGSLPWLKTWFHSSELILLLS